MAKKEMVDRPDHYQGDYVMRVIEDFSLDFCIGNSVKYLLRAGRKHSNIEEDLRKAQWYINRRLEQLQKGAKKKK
jgi:hypothetical protein